MTDMASGFSASGPHTWPRRCYDWPIRTFEWCPTTRVMTMDGGRKWTLAVISGAGGRCVRRASRIPSSDGWCLRPASGCGRRSGEAVGCIPVDPVPVDRRASPDTGHTRFWYVYATITG